MALYKLGDCEKAVECFDRIGAIDSNLFQPWTLKGYCYYSKKSYVNALYCYDRAITGKAPYPHESYYFKGLVLKDMNRNAESIVCLDSAISIKSDFYLAYFHKGLALQNINQYDAALNCYEKYSKFDQNEININFYMARMYYKKREYEKAIEYFKKSIEIDQKESTSFYNIACSYALLNNRIKMISYLREAILLDFKYKEKAKTDQDFKEYWSDAEFIKLLQ